MKQLFIPVLFGIVLVAGCAQKDPKYLTALERGEVQTELVSFKTIRDQTDAVLGYIEEMVWRETQRSGWQSGTEVFRASYIYDSSFKQLGFISAQGEARSYRKDIQGEVAYHGIASLEEGIRKILMIDPGKRIHIVEVEPLPRWELDLRK
jgi:hypothetical protein